MQRTSHRCPQCDKALLVHSDMWGPYYLCEGCGWTAEDEEQLKAATPAGEKVPHHVLSVAEAHRAWQTRRHAR